MSNVVDISKDKVLWRDPIVGRKLFKTKINPASQLKDERIGYEYMVVMDKDPREYWEGFCQKISLK